MSRAGGQRRPPATGRLVPWVVPAFFGVLALSTGSHAVRSVEQALAHDSSRLWLVALYGVLRTAVTVAFGVFTIGRAAPARPAREPVAFLACAVAMVAVSVFAAPPAGTPSALILAGEALAVTAGAWLVISVMFLGRCFGVLPEARGLVTHGPYALIRHPVYLGEIGAGVGLAIASPRLGNALLLGALLAAQLVRMRLEERALTRAFPHYRAYARQTPRLIPRVSAPLPHKVQV